jgi:hypothetical protein
MGSSHWCLASATCPTALGCDGTAAEHLSGRGEQVSVARAEHAVIAHFAEAMRQHVLEKPPHALLGRYRTRCALGRGRFLVLTGALAVCQLEKAVVAEGHPENIRGEIAQSLLASANRLTVHDPILVPYGLIDAWEQGGLVQAVSELRAEEPGQWLDGH